MDFQKYGREVESLTWAAAVAGPGEVDGAMGHLVEVLAASAKDRVKAMLDTVQSVRAAWVRQSMETIMTALAQAMTLGARILELAGPDLAPGSSRLEMEVFPLDSQGWAALQEEKRIQRKGFQNSAGVPGLEPIHKVSADTLAGLEGLEKRLALLGAGGQTARLDFALPAVDVPAMVHFIRALVQFRKDPKLNKELLALKTSLEDLKRGIEAVEVMAQDPDALQAEALRLVESCRASEGRA